MPREIRYRVWDQIRTRKTKWWEKLLFLLAGRGVVREVQDEKSGYIERADDGKRD